MNRFASQHSNLIPMIIITIIIIMVADLVATMVAQVQIMEVHLLMTTVEAQATITEVVPVRQGLRLIIPMHQKL